MRYTEAQKKVFGENVWVRRQLLGMSKDDLAKAFGCSTGMVNCWERGANVVSSNKMKDLADVLKCSAHELIRPYRIPQLSFSETSKVIEKKEEPVMCDADIIKAASEVFKNSYNSNEEYSRDVSNTETEEYMPYGHRVVDRVNKYLKDNNMSQNELSRRSSISNGTINRIVHGVLANSNPYYVKIEEYLDSVEANTDEPKKMSKPEIKTTKVAEEHIAEEPKVEEKNSISDRMNAIYNTLFNALDEMDKLKADIDKIEKVTAMLKEIQGL